MPPPVLPPRYAACRATGMFVTPARLAAHRAVGMLAVTDVCNIAYCVSTDAHRGLSDRALEQVCFTFLFALLHASHAYGASTAGVLPLCGPHIESVRV
jgi:hypothetical protein